MEITDTVSSASFLYIDLKCDTNDKIATKHYDKRDDFNIGIINYPYFFCNMPPALEYVYFTTHTFCIKTFYTVTYEFKDF